MGKGDARRPTLVREEEFEDNWNRIFRRRPPPPLEQTPDDDLPDHPDYPKEDT